MSSKQCLSQTAGVSVSRPKRPRLTKSQLERKRENDREAQRQIRIKTKNRMAHLESLVATLQESDGSRGRVFDLVQQVRDNHKVIDQLQEALKGIGRLVETTIQSSRPLSDQEPIQHDRTHHVGESSPGFVPPSCISTTRFRAPQFRLNLATTSSNILEHSSQAGLVVQSSLVEGMNSNETEFVKPSLLSTAVGQQETSTCIYEEPRAYSQTSPSNLLDGHTALSSNSINEIAVQIVQDRSLDGRLWYLAGTLLNYILSVPRKKQTPQEHSDDIPIRAVLHCWSDVAARYELDLGWQWLRQLDEKMYCSLGIPERLAVMRVMRLQYEVQVYPQRRPSLALPEFMTARPAQAYMQHDPLVEHWVWPGLREHLLFSPLKCATNRFMENFRDSFRFVWPFDPEDTYVRNTMTGMYSYSSDFVKRHNDLRSYSMRRDFFNLFPELRHDIPSIDPSPWNQNLLLTMKASEGNAPDKPGNCASETLDEEDLPQWPANYPNIIGQSMLPDFDLLSYGSEPTRH